jgi:hypothetical protein
MTRARLSRITRSIALVYALAIVAGIGLRIAFPAPGSLVYQTYRDLIPLIIALPAAYLAQAFQRRANYVQGLRALWSSMVGAIAAALAYTDTPAPSKEQFTDVLRRLSGAIEEVRGFYANVPSGTGTGWYPFEPIKQIHGVVRALGFGDAATDARRDEAHETIVLLWKAARERFLKELDVELPTHTHTASMSLDRSRPPPA